MLRYFNLDIKIAMGIPPHVGVGPSRGWDYQVTARFSEGEEKKATMHFPFDEQTLAERLREVEDDLYNVNQRAEGEQTIQNFGRVLFDALIFGEVRNLYEETREHLKREEDQRLRVRLHVDPPELAVLPWELMYDPGKREFLCLDRNISLVRYKELKDVLSPLEGEFPLKILGIASAPEDPASPNIKTVKRGIKKRLESLAKREKARLTWSQGATWEHLRGAMAGQDHWHVLHFIGYGKFDEKRNEGSILLVDAAGMSSPVSTSDFRMLLNHPSLRLVILSTLEGSKGDRSDNFSRTASILTSRTIPAVVAMQNKITNEAAIMFARAFYETLAKGESIDAAVTEARLAMKGLPNSMEWASLVLHMCSKDGILFKPAKAKESEQEKTTRPLVEGPASKKRKIGPLAIVAASLAILVVLALVGVGIYKVLGTSGGKGPVSTPSTSLRPHFRPTGLFSCVAGSITINGSTALWPLLTQVANDYMQKCHTAKITVLESDSGTGLKQAEDGQVDIGSSDLFVEELFSRSAMTDLVDYQVAGVIFAVIVNDQVGVTNLSPDDLKKIYTGVYTNWNKVGGPNLQITAYSRAADSGTRVTFERYVLGESVGITKPAPLDNTQEMVTKVHDTSGAIGYASLYDINQPNAPHVSIISINSNQPNIDNVIRKMYLFWNIEHLYTKGLARGLAKTFIDYLGSESASNFIEAHSFASSSQLPASH
jgi:phosphate transport system substrate-binding protein